jgi:hypothetical protein
MANTTLQLKRKYHIVYKTVNLINNKFYVGAHSTDNINDDYYGSGSNLILAIKKYGIDAFCKEILHVYDNPLEMFEKEKEIVNLEFISRSDVYNIVEGGYGGFNKGSKGLKHMHNPSTNERIAVHPVVISRMIEEGWIVGRNMSSTTNTVWIHLNEDKKMVSPTVAEKYISNGWTIGLPKSPTLGKNWIYFPLTNEYSLCEPSELPIKLKQGWIKKKWSPIEKGKSCWINNGYQNKRILIDQLNSWMLNGWSRGSIQNHKNRSSS